MNSHRTLTGRSLDLRGLDVRERQALAELVELYASRLTWAEFARRWPQLLRARVWGRRKVPVGTPLYRVAQDLELRLGVAEGRVAPPDYRDHLADLIEERFETRAAFCKATGIDPGNLSHVLAGRKDFSLEVLKKVGDVLDVQLDLVPRTEVLRKASILETDEGAERVGQLARKITLLDGLRRQATALPMKRRANVVPAAVGSVRDDLAGLRERLRDGAAFDEAIAEELSTAFDEQARLARRIAKDAERRRREARVG